MKKRVILLVMILTIAFSTTGCLIKSKADIEQREIVAVLGIDKEDDQIKLTAVTILVTPVDDGKSSGAKTSVFTAYGETIV